MNKKLWRMFAAVGFASSLAVGCVVSSSDDDDGTGGSGGEAGGGTGGTGGGTAGTGGGTAGSAGMSAGGAAGMGGAAGAGGMVGTEVCEPDANGGMCEECGKANCCQELVDCLNEADGRCAERQITINVDADGDGNPDDIDIDGDGNSDAMVEGEIVCLQVCVNHFFNVAEANGMVADDVMVRGECGAACADASDIGVSVATNAYFSCLGDQTAMTNCEIECGLIQ